MPALFRARIRPILDGPCRACRGGRYPCSHPPCQPSVCALSGRIRGVLIYLLLLVLAVILADILDIG